MPDLYTRRLKSAEAVASGNKPEKKNLATEMKEEVRRLAEFCRVPEGFRFEAQEAQEEIILLLRAHPITNLPWVLMATGMALAPFLLRFVPGLDFFPARFLAVGSLFWYLVTVAFVFEQFLNWYFNVYIVTDERIVDIDFVNLLYKRVSETKLDKIQDVTYSMGGVARSLFNFGHVFVQTAGEVTQFEFGNVPKPDQVVAVLRALTVQEEQEAIEGRVR